MFGQFQPIGMKEIGVILSIVVMDAALSGDNSIAISAMTSHLKDGLRQKAIYLGMVFAALLRFVALFFASFIIRNPWVQMIGALYLIHLCVEHFRKDEDESEGFAHREKGFFATLAAVGVLDLSLSLDNVVAITSMTTNLSVIVLGVAISIGMLAVATKITMWLMGKFPSIQDAAYVILAFLGCNMLAGHTSEFLIWVNEMLTKHHDFVSHFKLVIGEIGEIAGVAIIIGFSLVKDIMFKNKPDASSNTSSASAPVISE
jgi:YkoY family integral membrane protein